MTSSPGVVQPVRKAVRHSGFEGPLTGALLEAHGSQIGSNVGMDETQGWAAYMSSMDSFRKDLKHIHTLEEEMSRVRRDREILVTRLIKTTKARPTKADLASNYSQANLNMSSRGSSVSITSDGSAATKESKRAGKLADAQAELLGCEEHLRGLEVRIETERNKVMLRGLEEKFRAMEAVGRMWVSQAKKGLGDLDRSNGELWLILRSLFFNFRHLSADLPANAFELDSNGSIAPSQSASQMGYEDSQPRHRGVPFPKGLHGANGPGSITGSIAEENEDSSDDGGGRRLTVHENRPGTATPRPGSAQAGRMNNGSRLTDRGPGMPSVTDYRPRPMSGYGGGGDDSDSEVGPGTRRRAASDVGAMSYTPITKKRQSLLRRRSTDGQPSQGQRQEQNGNRLQRHNSGSSSASGRGGVPVKKKGFFASIGRLFKGGSRRGGGGSGRESPPYGSGSGTVFGGNRKGGWATRTETNLKRANSSGFGRRGGGGNNDGSSSEDEGGGNLVSVSNNRMSWSADNVGRGPVNIGKRNSNIPVASGLIPAKPTRGDLGSRAGAGSTSTVTAQNTLGSRAGAKSPTTGLGRSNTGRSSASVGAKSATSVGTAKTGGTVRSGTTKKTRPNGSISRATGLSSQPATKQNNMMSLVAKPDPKNPAVPMMPDIPKAPRSQVTPQLELPKAPGSSIVRPGDAPSQIVGKDELYPHQSISRNNSLQKVPQVSKDSSSAPLPSRFQPPPLKSALRPSSPQPLAPPLEMPSTLVSVSAPGPVEVQRETRPLPSSFPIAPAHARPRPDTRTSYASQVTSEGASVYESAVDGDEHRDYGAETSDDDDDEENQGRYEAVDNERVKRLGINVGPPAVERVPSGDLDNDSEEDEDESVHTELAQNQGQGPRGIEDDRASRVSRTSNRKSVRITAPDSELDAAQAPAPLTEGYADKTSRDPSPEPTRATDQKWSTRIGRMRDDTSEDEDEDDGYSKARKGLSRNSGQFEQQAQGGDKVKKSKSGSVRSKGSSRR